MTVVIEFACGHRETGRIDTMSDPRCGTCGSRHVSHVAEAMRRKDGTVVPGGAPVPRIRGPVRGPHVTSADLPAVAVTIGRGGPLPLKES